MLKYDYFIAGKWRNKDNVKLVLDIVRASGKTAYCFIENDYKGKSIEFDIINGNPEIFMKLSEQKPQNDPLIREIFDNDMNAQKNSDAFLIVLPAGTSSHIEAGAAFGMGKKCYAVGQLEKTETLYCIFDNIFDDVNALKTWIKKQ